jgi:signal transduction histidine kinase
MGEPILVTEPAIANLNALPVRSVESLMQFGGAQMYARRVRVHGVVIHTQTADGVWIRDGKYGLRVVCIGDTPLGVGMEVDAFGFFARSEFGTMMEDAIVRRTRATASVDPIHLTNAVEALDHDSDLVECEVIIHERWQALDGIRLKLSDGMTEFPAVLRLTNHAALPSQWLPGARIRAVGISSVAFFTQSMTPGTLQPQSFQILLRSPADIQILQGPPWWNPEHVAWLTGGVSILLLLAVGIVIWIGRRHLREQAIERMKAEAEFSAVMNERNRMAREFHDTLAQGLGAISLQLEVAKRQLPADSNAQKPLGEAGAQTRASLDEVRNAIWNMRSQVLETGDLASALNGVLHALADPNQLQVELKVIGEPKRFAPVVENNLLRIGQEAIANAVKYAQAKRIEVVLKFAERQFELCVSDDGCGFDPSHPPASEGGFGLVGMRERVAELNGELNVSSAPGKGSIVKLTMPLSIS